jgi:hypothetical protein
MGVSIMTCEAASYLRPLAPASVRRHFRPQPHFGGEDPEPALDRVAEEGGIAFADFEPERVPVAAEPLFFRHAQ